MNDLTQRDADEYGAHVKAGGWRLGLLVARNVEKGQGQTSGLKQGGSPRKAADSHTEKVSLADFATQSGVHRKRVATHYDAWEKAAAAGIVPPGGTLSPGQDVKLPDAEKWDEFYVPVSGGYNGGADRTPTVSNVKAGLDKLTPSERGEVLADLVHDDQAYAEAPDHAKQKMAGKFAEMIDTATTVGKKKLNEASRDSHGWNHVQFAISDASEKVAQATSEALHLQHGAEIANDNSMLGVKSAVQRLDTNVREFKTLMGINTEVPA